MLALRLAALARLGLGLALSGTCGVGAVFNIRSRLSSSREGFFVMTTNPWDIRETLDFDATPDPIYLNIGRALTGWEVLEQQISRLFGFFCGGDDPLPSRRAYGSVISFQGRAEMLRVAAEGYFYARPDHAMERRFHALLVEVGKFSARRNEIAHGVVGIPFYVMGPGSGLSAYEPRYALMPSEYATNKHALLKGSMEGHELGEMRRKYAYSSTDVDHYRAEFRRMQGDYSQLILDWWDADPDEGPLVPL